MGRPCSVRSTRATLDLLAVDQLDPSPRQLERAASLLRAEHAIRGRPRGTGETRELDLGAPQGLVARIGGEVEQPAQQPPSGIDGDRLDQTFGRRPDLVGEERDQQLRDVRVLPPQSVEVGLADRAGLADVERFDCRRTVWLVRDDRELANDSPGPRSASVTVSPSGVTMRIAKRPRTTRWSASAGSPSWNTTSPRPNVRRRAAASNRRRLASGTPSSKRRGGRSCICGV